MSEFYSLILDVNPNNTNKSHVSFHFNDLKLIIGTHEKIEGKAKDKYRKMGFGKMIDKGEIKFAKGGRAAYKDGSKGCGKANKGKGRAYGQNS